MAFCQIQKYGYWCWTRHLFWSPFFKGDHITVYFGKQADPNNPDCSQKLKVKNGKVLGIQPDELGRRPLYFGGHFGNTPYFIIGDREWEYYDRNTHAGKNANCQCEGCIIICTLRIQKCWELRLDYGRNKNLLKLPQALQSMSTNLYKKQSFVFMFRAFYNWSKKIALYYEIVYCNHYYILY